jgi:hypothetical protein
MLIMETKNKLNYEVTNEEAYVYEFLLYVDFIYQDKKYNARANYTNDGWGMDNVEVYDCEDNYIDDDIIIEIANDAIYNMNINKETITW